MALLTRTPALPDWHSDPRVRQIHDRLEQFDREYNEITGTLAKAQRTAAEAQDAYDQAELGFLTGSGSEATRAKAQEKLDAALLEVRRQEAFVTVNRADRKRVEDLTVDVIDEAKVRCRAELKAVYADQIAAMDEALRTASDASEDAYRTWEHGQELFGVFSEVSPRGVHHPSYGGLMKMSWAPLARLGQRQHNVDVGEGNTSRYEGWRQDAIERGWVKS